MAHPAAKLLTAFFVVAVLLVVAALIFTLGQPAAALAPLPNPNGYEDFVKAGRMVADDSPGDGTMSEEDLRAFVKKNAEALNLARAGLSRECRVPLEYSATIDTHHQDLSVLKRLAFTLKAEGRLAEMENRPGEAAESYLGVVRLGHAVSRGGVMIDSLVGLAIEAIGVTRLENLSRNLDANQCREVASALETAESGRESAQTILNQEHVWARRTGGLKGQLARLVMFKTPQQVEQKWAGRVAAQQARTRSLLVQLATRAYELEKGERPKSLADLVPVYLKTIPQDPLTGTNMAYHP
jgi:hypothetical protein